MTQTDLKVVSVASELKEPELVVLEPKIADASASVVHTYHATRWSFVNHLLDSVDFITHGRAGQLQRFISFAFFGGLAALVNLGVLYVVYSHTLQSVDENARQIIAFLVAAEISIVVNFSLNDYFTFRHLPGHTRAWGVRCVRFHLTSTTGIILTLLINISLNHVLHVPFVLAQAIAILIVLFYNFTAHHLFTYRHAKAVVVN